MRKFLKTGAVLLGFVLCFGAGALSWAYLSRYRAEDFNKYEQILSVLENNWYYSDQVEDIEDRALGYAVSGNSLEAEDPYTQYLSNDAANNLNLKLAGKSAGIGIVYKFTDGQVRIGQVFVNSPADKAGILAGDVLVSLDGMELTEENVGSVPEYISEAETLTAEISRDGETFEVELTPSDFDATVSMDVQDDYGYVKISSFSSGTGDDFYDALKRIKNQNLDTLILDLRDNTGGTTDSAIAVASALLEQGSVIYQEQYPDGSTEQYITQLKYNPVDFENILVLQNEDTASSSEIVIGALQDYLPDQVTTIGQTSFGKGSVQYYFTFEDGTSLKFTRALWLTPSGESINKVGITPEIEVETLIPSVTYYGSSPVEPDTVNVDAVALQAMLQYLGYDVARTDSYYPWQSAEALMQFQSDHGLEATGIGDEKTFEVLIDAFKQKKSEDSRDLELETAVEWINQNTQ